MYMCFDLLFWSSLSFWLAGWPTSLDVAANISSQCHNVAPKHHHHLRSNSSAPSDSKGKRSWGLRCRLGTALTSNCTILSVSVSRTDVYLSFISWYVKTQATVVYALMELILSSLCTSIQRLYNLLKVWTLNTSLMERTFLFMVWISFIPYSSFSCQTTIGRKIIPLIPSLFVLLPHFSPNKQAPRN